jgi:hypothetical protein
MLARRLVMLARRLVSRKRMDHILKNSPESRPNKTVAPAPIAIRLSRT